ncbi:hypothetical protein [Azospirillum sp. sgz301742]
MLVALSMVFCMVSEPTQCQTVKPVIPDDQPLSMSSCQIAGQIEGAKWINDHPKFRMTRVLCTVGNRPKQEGA